MFYQNGLFLPSLHQHFFSLIQTGMSYLDNRELQRCTITQWKPNLLKCQLYFPETGQSVYHKTRSRCRATYELALPAFFIHFAVTKIQYDHWSPDVVQRLKTRFGDAFSSIFPSITSDNGSECSELTEAVDRDQVSVYYTHPYTSSERGTNERHNRLIRRFIPKGQSIDDLDDPSLPMWKIGATPYPAKYWGISFLTTVTNRCFHSFYNHK
nr:IS30 family transposase [Salibacterium halotolerans]